VVLESTPRRVRLAVDSVSRVPPLTPALWLVQALAKGDRDERAVEACTELGVDHIIPWQAARSISRWTAEKELKGVARWQRIATEASKQSLRAWVPQVGTFGTVGRTAGPRLAHSDGGVEPGCGDVGCCCREAR